DLRHRRDQAIPLRDAERGQDGFCEHVGATIELSDFAQPRSSQSHATDTAIVRRRLRSHQPLTLERAQEATDVTGIELQSRAQIADLRAGGPDFVEKPRFPEWTVAIEKMVLERANALADRSVEAAHAAHQLRIHSLTIVREWGRDQSFAAVADPARLARPRAQTGAVLNATSTINFAPPAPSTWRSAPRGRRWSRGSRCAPRGAAAGASS